MGKRRAATPKSWKYLVQIDWSLGKGTGAGWKRNHFRFVDCLLQAPEGQLRNLVSIYKTHPRLWLVQEVVLARKHTKTWFHVVIQAACPKVASPKWDATFPNFSVAVADAKYLFVTWPWSQVWYDAVSETWKLEEAKTTMPRPGYF